MSEETTTDQLAEIEGQAEFTTATEYTPPEGWRLLAVGELVMLDDQWVRQDGSVWRSMGTEGPVSKGARYIRRIEPRPQQDGLVRDVTHLLQESGVLDSAKAEKQIEELRSEVSYVQRLLGESRQRVTQLEELVASLRTINDAQEKTVRLAGQENTDLQHRLSVVSKEWADQAATCNGLQQQVENQQQEYERQKSRIEFLETLNAGNGAAIGDYVAKIAKLQGLVDTARQQLEASATECDSVSTRLEAVAAERDEQAETIRRLRIELDAAQQVPQAVSDRFEEGWDAGTARAVETIAEWTEPFRTCGSERLALAVMANLPHIMRSLTGLTDED